MIRIFVINTVCFPHTKWWVFITESLRIWEKWQFHFELILFLCVCCLQENQETFVGTAGMFLTLWHDILRSWYSAFIMEYILCTRWCTWSNNTEIIGYVKSLKVRLSIQIKLLPFCPVFCKSFHKNTLTTDQAVHVVV